MTECVTHKSVLLSWFNICTTFPSSVKTHDNLIKRELSRVIIPGWIMTRVVNQCWIFTPGHNSTSNYDPSIIEGGRQCEREGEKRGRERGGDGAGEGRRGRREKRGREEGKRRREGEKGKEREGGRGKRLKLRARSARRSEEGGGRQGGGRGR